MFLRSLIDEKKGNRFLAFFLLLDWLLPSHMPWIIPYVNRREWRLLYTLYFFKYLFIWLCWVLAAAGRIFHLCCSRQRLLQHSGSLVAACERLGFPGAQWIKKPPAMQKTRVWSLGREDSLEKEVTTHSSFLAWRIPWTEEPSGLQSMVARVGDNLETKLLPTTTVSS